MKFKKQNDLTLPANSPSIFSAEQCDTLFSAILVHDGIHLNAELPEAICLDYSQQQLRQCYQICLQLWKESADRKSLCMIAEKAFWRRRFNEADQAAFMQVRAKFKHMRFAYMTFDNHHCYPFNFHRLTRRMGQLQDTLKNGKDSAVMYLAIRLRIILSRFYYPFSTKEIECFQLCTPESFSQHINNQIQFIRLKLSKKVITSKEFHEVRKVISQQVALYDNLKSLYPSPYHQSISLYLNTINGLMGSKHDELIARKFNKKQEYESYTFKMPEEIRNRLTALTERYEPANLPGELINGL